MHRDQNLVQARTEDCGPPGFDLAHSFLALAGKAIRRDREDPVHTSTIKPLARWTGMAIAVSAVVAVASSASLAAAAVAIYGRPIAHIGVLRSPVAPRSGWSVVPTQNGAAPTGELLFGTCVTASACVAVGTHVKASGAGVTLAERWNGKKWAIQKTPNPTRAVISVLTGVACQSSSACMAVGYWVPRSGALMPLAERWNGSTWRLEPMPSPAGSQQVFPTAVACTSSSACIGVGDYLNHAGVQVNLAERWNGTRWATQHTPKLTGAQWAFLDDVSCPKVSACTAVGQTSIGTLAERWNGTSWRIQPTPSPSSGGAGLLGVACTSRLSCTADGLSNAGSLVEWWNGTRWRIQHTPNPVGTQGIFLNNVACSSATACTAVGAYFTGSANFEPVVERWNGRRWAIQPTRSPAGAQGNFLFAVACPAHSACTAFGLSDGSGTARTMAQRWNGTDWRIQRTPNLTGAAASQFDGISCTSRSACIGVGVSGNQPLAERWNGTAWKKQPLPSVPGAFLNAVSCTSSSACIAVGGSASRNVAERWNGTRWTRLPIPTPVGAHGAGLGGISCTSASNCIAAGAYSSTSSQNGPVLPETEQWNGSTWTILTTPHAAQAIQTFPNNVSCTSPTACTIAGEQHFASGVVHTVAERWNGSTWTIQPTPNPSGVQFASFGGVDCTGPSDCLAVGFSDKGTLAERWDGSTWTIDTIPNPPGGGQLNAVACALPSVCTAIGFTFTATGGMLLAERWNGTRWSIQPTPLIPAAWDMGLPSIACPTVSWCSAVDGRTSFGGNPVTLAEQWRGGTTASASRPVLTATGSGPVCAPPVIAATDPEMSLFWRTRCLNRQLSWWRLTK